MKHRADLYALLLCAYTVSGYAFEEKPWLGDPWSFYAKTDFSYNRYRRIQDAAVQLTAPSNDYLLALDLGLSPFVRWDAQFELEIAQTPRQSLGWRSLGIEGRFAWLDDIQGDPLSLTTGLSVREVPRHSLRDVSCPYHSDFNAELNAAMGKEWSADGYWTYHAWGLLGVGMANHGFPWLRLFAAWESNWNTHHRLEVRAMSYIGFGTEQHVDVNHFNGWAKFQHRSIDVGIGYGYYFNQWGTLKILYDRRVYAHVFPQNVNFFTISYYVPFSLL